MSLLKYESHRVAVIGAGPIGIETALYARTVGFSVTVFERTQVGAYVRQWGHVRLFSPFGMNVTSLGRTAIRTADPKHDFPVDSACITGREHMAAYLEPLTKTETLRGCIRTDTQVMAIGRHGCLKSDGADDPKRIKQPFRLLVRDSKNKETVEEADVVLDCTGTYGHHRWAGDGGIPAVGERAAEASIAYGLEDVGGERRGVYAGKTVLVIGAGYSAATTMCNLAELAEKHPDTWIIWLARGSATQPLHRLTNDPLRERDRLAVRANTLATRGEGVVEFHGQSVVETIESLGPDKGFRVTARVAGKPRTFEADRVIANVGYMPDMAMLRELHVGDLHRPFETPIKHLRQPEPSLFVLGAKSYGRDSRFLLNDGFQQVPEVFALLTGKPGLDLYRTPAR